MKLSSDKSLRTSIRPMTNEAENTNTEPSCKMNFRLKENDHFLRKNIDKTKTINRSQSRDVNDGRKYYNLDLKNVSRSPKAKSRGNIDCSSSMCARQDK